jgi:glycosyltransferase involved in cell wall biosynthesis
MNILYVLNSGKMGGMEKHALNLVEGMMGKNQRVFVWCPEGDMSSIYLEKGALVSNKKIRHDLDLSYIWELSKFIRKNHIDVLHSHELKAVFHSLIAGFLSGVKVRISHIHTPISTWKINKIKRYVDVEIYTLLVNLLSSKEIALTKSVSERKQHEGIKKEKIVVIPNAVDTSGLALSYSERMAFREEIRKRYLIPQADLVFGCVGRLTEEKGHDVLIKAFKDFLDPELFHKNSFYLIIAGGGKLEPKLRDLAKELSIEDKVIITGVFSDKDKIKFYSSFNVFVFPSYTEGFGISLIEAMYLNIPAICSNLEVLKEVGGDTTRYFNTGSPTDLAEKMTRMYEDILSNKDLGLDKARLKVESEYTMDGFVSSYLALYQSLL